MRKSSDKSLLPHALKPGMGKDNCRAAIWKNLHRLGFMFAKPRQSSLSMGTFSHRPIRPEPCSFRGWEARLGKQFQFGLGCSLDSVCFKGRCMKEVTYVYIKGWFSLPFQISLHFQAFELQRTRGCQGDYVKVYDGSSKSSAVLMDKTCGSKIPSDVVASSNLMLVEFITDGAGSAAGFQATFTSGRSENKENGKENQSVSNQPSSSQRKNIV